MTRRQTRNRSMRVVSAGDLQSYIAGLIASAPRTVEELSTLTGYSIHALNQRVHALEAAGTIHRTRVVQGRSWGYVWHNGPSLAHAHPVERPRQSTVLIYPPINRRDPSVMAIFGMEPAPSLVLEAEH